MKHRAPFAYVSIRCLATGPVAWTNELLSLGAAAFTGDGEPLGDWRRNLELTLDDSGDAKTMQWWNKRPDVFAATRLALVHPTVAMREFQEWLTSLAPKLECMGSAWDWMWVYQYLLAYQGECLLGRRPLDLSSWASAHGAKLAAPPASVFDALEDASNNGRWFFEQQRKVEDDG